MEEYTPPKSNEEIIKQFFWPKPHKKYTIAIKVYKNKEGSNLSKDFELKLLLLLSILAGLATSSFVVFSYKQMELGVFPYFNIVTITLLGVVSSMFIVMYFCLCFAIFESSKLVYEKFKR